MGVRWCGGSARMGAVALAIALTAGGARADDATGAEVVVAPPPDSAGLSFFPRGDVFRPLIADPKAEGSFLSYVNNERARVALGTHMGSVGIGDQLGLVRWRSAGGERTFQASLAGNVYSQFNIGTAPTGLVNADYSLGVPLAYRSGRFAARLRLYHQSSHLGDGVLVGGRVPRESSSFESVDLVLAVTTGELRAYGGGEYRMEGRRLQYPSWVAHWGFELRERDPLLSRGALSRTRLVAALDVKAFEQANWVRSWSARGGLEIGRTRDGGRSWAVLAEYFAGPAPFGQFAREQLRYLGMGLHLGL
jgi:hypothetical protein